jgi:hypothetical protein
LRVLVRVVQLAAGARQILTGVLGSATLFGLIDKRSSLSQVRGGLRRAGAASDQPKHQRK